MGDLAAPVGDRELKLCANCFFVLPSGAEKCPDCGAVVGEVAAIAAGNAEVYTELARANLFRMRGEFRKAEDVCRAILRRFPNDPSSAALLGDICLEEEQLEDSARWYELSIDSSPDPAVKRKLDIVHRRLKEREALSTAEQLGLPATKPRAGLFAALLLGFIIAVGIAAFLLGKTNAENKLKNPGSKVNVPFEAGGMPTINTPTTNSNETISSVSSSTGPTNTVGKWLAELRTKSAEGARLTDAWQDPRTKTLYLALRLDEGDNERLLVARLARTALDHAIDAPRIKVRGSRHGEDVYFADVERTALANVDPKLAESDPVAFANALLSNEFPPAPTVPVTTESETTGTAGDPPSNPDGANGANGSGQ